MEILYWPIKEGLKKETIENYRTAYALKLRNSSPIDIIKELTFDHAVPKITLEDIDKLLDFIEKKLIKRYFQGIGLEVGAGPATFSSVLAKSAKVEKMYALEICQPIVKDLSPKVVEYILGEHAGKITAVCGDFNHISLPDNSLDFIFDFFSLHHSNNLTETIAECYRVLKPGGFIICLDKARPDIYSQTDLDEMLETEYDDSFKKHFGLPLGDKLTRRMNGEHEFRLRDWLDYFNKAGFGKMSNYYLAKTNGNVIKEMISILPIKIQSQLTRLMPKPKYKHKFILSAENQIFCKLVNPFPKEISLLVARKK